MIPYTDTHCHIDFEDFDKDREKVLQRAWKNGIAWILNPGIDIQTNQAAIDLAQSHPQKLWAAVGIHPNHGTNWTPMILSTLKEQAKQTGVVAIGEIGLDYYRQHTPFDQQQILFNEQLDIAAEMNLPVIIHNRQSTADLISILTKWHRKLVSIGHPLANRPGVLHSYSGDYETAMTVIDMNFFIGISGPVTFKNAPDQKTIVSRLPIERILLETDAPFLTPDPHRGRRNEPSYIPLIAEEIARLKNKTPKEIAEITYANANYLFGFAEIK
jgi:TatD DNase family protein